MNESRRGQWRLTRTVWRRSTVDGSILVTIDRDANLADGVRADTEVGVLHVDGERHDDQTGDEVDHGQRDDVAVTDPSTNRARRRVTDSARWCRRSTRGCLCALWTRTAPERCRPIPWYSETPACTAPPTHGEPRGNRRQQTSPPAPLARGTRALDPVDLCSPSSAR